MRKLALIAVILLASAPAFAGPSRGLSLASTEPTQQVPNQPNTEQKSDTPPAAVERPKLVVPQEQPKAPVVADKPTGPPKPKGKRISTEARVIYELHRHGIYW
jgi:outer membrane biosynthesis protein TonB